MCTVSIISRSDGFRLVCNRDELRLRAAARPPSIFQIRGINVLMPIDGESGGTWIAGTENGLAFALLNLNERDGSQSPDGARSRGEIIPQLVACRSVDEAAVALRSLPDRPYRPFRLIMAACDGVIEMRQSPPLSRRQPLSAPVMFTSSGLGDHLVEAPRRALFEEMMAGPGDPVRKQDSFHRHRWPSLPHISVSMQRAEASTVSRTVLEIGGQWVHIEYTAVGEGEGESADPVTHALDMPARPDSQRSQSSR